MTMRDWEEEQQPIVLWPDNERAYQVWTRVCSQWLCGPAGFFALNLAVVHLELGRMRLSDDDYDALLEDVRHIEMAALETISGR